MRQQEKEMNVKISLEELESHILTRNGWEEGRRNNTHKMKEYFTNILLWLASVHIQKELGKASMDKRKGINEEKWQAGVGRGEKGDRQDSLGKQVYQILLSLFWDSFIPFQWADGASGWPQAPSPWVLGLCSSGSQMAGKQIPWRSLMVLLSGRTDSNTLSFSYFTLWKL